MYSTIRSSPGGLVNKGSCEIDGEEFEVYYEGRTGYLCKGPLTGDYPQDLNTVVGSIKHGQSLSRRIEPVIKSYGSAGEAVGDIKKIKQNKPDDVEVKSATPYYHEDGVLVQLEYIMPRILTEEEAYEECNNLNRNDDCVNCFGVYDSIGGIDKSPVVYREDGVRLSWVNDQLSSEDAIGVAAITGQRVSSLIDNRYGHIGLHGGNLILKGDNHVGDVLVTDGSEMRKLDEVENAEEVINNTWLSVLLNTAENLQRRNELSVDVLLENSSLELTEDETQRVKEGLPYGRKFEVYEIIM